MATFRSYSKEESYSCIFWNHKSAHGLVCAYDDRSNDILPFVFFAFPLIPLVYSKIQTVIGISTAKSIFDTDFTNVILFS